MPAVAQLSNRKIDEGQAMNDLVAGFLKFRETGYQERTELFEGDPHGVDQRKPPLNTTGEKS
jgi:hypothetical protein